jgi:hypothetical protein
MWIIGTVSVLVVGAAVTAALGWSPRVTSNPPLWDIPELGRTFAGSVGSLAGFSLAATIFTAGLDNARTSPLFATVFGMMLVGFLILVVAVWIIASTPNMPHADGATAQALALVLGSLCGNLGVSISWLALAPLMAMIGLSSLANVFIWPLLIMVLVAGGWSALFAYRLTTASALACLAIPVLGFASPALYRLAAVRLWPTLWPGSGSSLPFAFLALGAAGLLFALQLGLFAAYGNKQMQERLGRDGHRIALASSQASVAVMGLIWFAVALP